MGPIRTLAIVTGLKELLESKIVASDQSKMIAPHSIHTLCIPTGPPNEDSDLVRNYLFREMNTHIESLTGGNTSLGKISMVALDDRLKLSSDAISTRRREPDDFRIKCYHAASIARTQGSDCVLYVSTTEGSSAHHGLTYVTRMVWQGRNDIPRIFVPQGLSAMLNTFRLAMTDSTGRTTCSQPLVVQSLIDHVTDLCQNQHDSLSQLTDSTDASQVNFHLTVDSENARAVQVLEECRNRLRDLGESTKPEGSKHTVEVRVGGQHSVTPAGYRVMAQDVE